MPEMPDALRFYAQELADQERDRTADLLPTVQESIAPSVADRGRMLATARMLAALPRHRAAYPGVLAETRKATRRLATRATPTHRGAARNA